METILDPLAVRGAAPADPTGFTYLIDGECDAIHMSYAELDRRSRVAAADTPWSTS